MFENQSRIIAFRGFMVSVCLAVLAGCGGGSNSANSATSSSPDAAQPTTIEMPAAPTGLAASPGNAKASLTWSGSTGATGYHVKRATANGGPYTQVGAPTSATYSDTSLANGTKYYYVVSALNTAGESPNSAQASATPDPVAPTPPGNAPSAPTNLTATAGDDTASLAWSPSSGATSYHVKRATTSGGPYTQVATATATSYSDASLTNGTTYYFVVSAVSSGGESSNSGQVSVLPKAPTGTGASNACGMQLGDTAIIFCDTFDAPAPSVSRAGDLNANVWGVSRQMGGGTNFGQNEYNLWNSTLIDKCDGSQPRVNAPNDIIICNGQLREAANDNNSGVFDEGDVISLAMYPKQPFDFAGRTGTVSFDVSNDTAGSHAAWPEFWLSDLPVPDPFNHFDSWQTLPANGLGIRFHAAAPIGQWGACPNGNNLNQWRWTVGSAAVVRGYVLDDSEGYGVRTAMDVKQLDCVIESGGPGQMNHIELRISQNQVDVYATDAGVAATPATLKHIAVITNTNLTLSRGLIWIEDVHYNADKSGQPRPSQREHTFAWDNVAFDGPFVYRDFSYDALDNTAPGPNGAISLGKYSAAGQTTTWNVAGIPANPKATAARVLFNFNAGDNANPTVLNAIINGHAHSVAWPYPDSMKTLRTFAITIPITDLVAGTNVVQLGADVAEAFYNVNVVIVDVTGGVPVLPGANDAYPVN
jgi:hypothetical protein